MTNKLDIPFPLGGLDKSTPFTDQQPRTSRDMLNVELVDRKNSLLRVRGSQRGGMSHYLDTPAAFANIVRRLDACILDEHRFTYGYAGSPAADFSMKANGSVSSSCVVTDQFGDVYWLEGDNGWVKTNASGGVIWRQPIAVLQAGGTPGAAAYLLTSIVVDDDRSVYVATGSFTGTLHPNTWTNSVIWKWRINDEGNGYVLSWALNPTNYLVPQLRIKDGSLFALMVDWSATAGTRTSTIMWYDDIALPDDQPPTGSNGLPNNTDHRLQNVITQAFLGGVFTGQDVLGHSFDIKGYDTGVGGNGYQFLICGGNNKDATNGRKFLTKVDVERNLLWAASFTVNGVVAGPGAIGFGCKFDSDGNFVTLGPDGDGVGAAGHDWLTKYTDVAAGGTPTRAWGKSATGFTIGYSYPRFPFDVRNAVYVPFYEQTGGVGGEAVHVYNTSGTLLTGTGLLPAYPTSSASRICRSTAIPPSNPENEPVFRTDDQKIAEAVYCANLESAAPDVRALQRRRLITVTLTNASARSVILVAAHPPDIQIFKKATGIATPTNGSGALTSTARYVSTAFLFGKLFVADGVGKYRYFDPPHAGQTTNPNGIVQEFVSTTSGIIPPRGRLLFAWRARLGIGRTADDPHNIYMSAEGDPFNWDFAPIVQTIGDAFMGNLTVAGAVPDLPNSFIPINDDILLILCDHSIWILRGNPLRGGEFDRISGVVGGSFGKPWCVDPEGNVFFHGSRGGIFAMSPGSQPQRISTTSIDSDLATIDLSTTYVEMMWDDSLQGLRVFTLPYGGVGAGVRKHWNFEKRTGAWVPQRYGSTASTAVQPTAVALVDGDGPSDRILLAAGEDKYVGYFNQNVRTDRGTVVYSYALIGPIVTRAQSPDRSRLCSLEVTLAADRGQCQYELFASDTPDVLGTAFGAGLLQPGYNKIRTRARGRYLFLRLFNADLDNDWAFESAVAVTADAGRVKA